MSAGDTVPASGAGPQGGRALCRPPGYGCEGRAERMQTYRPDIDGLRAVAVIPVVLYHAGLPALSGGFVGVDVFFVISGFLITGILRDELAAGRFSIIGFYERRARRILPALAAVILACLAAGLALAGPKELERLAQSALATLFFGSNIWFWQATSGYFAPDAELEPLLHSWSLAVEEQFYIVFPILLWLLFPRPRWLLLGVIWAACAASLAIAVIGVARAPSASFYLIPTRAWELGLGVVLALGGLPGTRAVWLREAIALAGLAAILGAMLLYDGATPFPGLAALPPCLGTAALIWAGMQGPTLTGRILALRPMVFVGLISYSLYLWHWPLMAFLRLHLGSAVLPFWPAAAAVAAAFVMAVLSWALIERPFRRRPPAGFSRRTIFSASAATIAGLGLLSAVIWAGGGLPERFPPIVRAAFAAARDINTAPADCVGRLPEAGLCRFGADADRDGPADVLLWGDSHAFASMPGVDAALRAAGLSGIFAGRNGCPPLLGVTRADGGRPGDCAAFAAAVMTWLQGRTDMKLVILSARWALAAEGWRVPGEAGGPAILARPEGPYPRDPSGNAALFREGLAATVAALRATGRRVIILGGVPEIGWNVPDQLARHLHWGRPLPPVPDLAAVQRRAARADAVLRALAAQEGVQLVPLAPAMCTPLCRVAEGERALYHDDDHLSRFGAIRVIAPLVMAALARN